MPVEGIGLSGREKRSSGDVQPELAMDTCGLNARNRRIRSLVAGWVRTQWAPAGWGEYPVEPSASHPREFLQGLRKAQGIVRQGDGAQVFGVELSCARQGQLK